MHHDDMKAVNTEAAPDAVLPRKISPQLTDGAVRLPAASWNVLWFTKQG